MSDDWNLAARKGFLSTPPAAEADAELIARLRGAYSTVFERSLAKRAADLIEALQAERDAAAKDAETGRAILARVYAGAALYCDDGEMQDNREPPFIDFKRDSFDDIREAMMRRAAIAAKL